MSLQPPFWLLGGEAIPFYTKYLARQEITSAHRPAFGAGDRLAMTFDK